MYICLGTFKSFLVYLPECNRSLVWGPSILVSSIPDLLLASLAAEYPALETGQIYLHNLRRAGLEGWANERRRKAPPVVLPKHGGNWGFLYIVKRLRAVSFVIPYPSWRTFLVLAFQTTDGSHLESFGFCYRSNSMWNRFSEPKHLRQTKDAADLIVLYSSFNVEGRGCVDCLTKGLMYSPWGPRATTSLRSGFLLLLHNSCLHLPVEEAMLRARKQNRVW